MRPYLRAFLFLLFFLSLAPAGSAEELVIVTGSGFTSKQGYVSLNVSLTAPTEFIHGRLGDPRCIFVLLQNTDLKMDIDRKITVNEGGVKSLELVKYKKKRVGLHVCFEEKNHPYKVMLLRNVPEIVVTVPSRGEPKTVTAMEDQARTDPSIKPGATKPAGEGPNAADGVAETSPAPVAPLAGPAAMQGDEKVAQVKEAVDGKIGSRAVPDVASRQSLQALNVEPEASQAKPSGTIQWKEYAHGRNTLNGVACYRGFCVAAGNRGTILYSIDGDRWNPAKSGNLSNLYGVAFGKETFVVVGAGGTAHTSRDGIRWKTQVLKGSTWLNGAAFGRDIFVAVGDYGTILTSPDGVNWKSRASGVNKWLSATTFANNTFVVVGANGTILTSPDGINWKSQASGVTNWLSGIAFVNNTFVVVGDSGTILTSPDGENWVQTRIPGLKSLYSIASREDVIVAVGESGLILRTQREVTGGLADRGTGTAAENAPTTTVKPGSGQGTISMESRPGVEKTPPAVKGLGEDGNHFLLTVRKSGTGLGAVNGNGIQCDAKVCTGTYLQVTQVTLSATADAGSTFVGWNGCDAVAGNKCTLIITSNKTVTGAFNRNQYTLTTVRSGNGSGTVGGDRLICTGNTCTGTYDHGTQVTLSATADAGSTFVGWNGCDAVNGALCKITLRSPRGVIAAFE